LATVTTGPAWADHTQDGIAYSARHLHPRFDDYHVPAIAPTKSKPGRAALSVKVRFSYSHHCFTRNLEDVPGADPEHYYNCTKRPNETRVFCPNRWNESHALPAIMAGLTSCYFSGRHNFFVWRDPKDSSLGEYFVYFSLALHKNGFIDIVIESAYPRTDGERLKNAGKTSLNTLIANAVGGKKTFNPAR
jgi:hypothetical protein